jgi:hypothetical protein
MITNLNEKMKGAKKQYDTYCFALGYALLAVT